MKTCTITVGIGGATSSGKTTLAKQLCAVLPNCTVIHQDSYWSDCNECIIHPVRHEPDAADPRTAIKWPLFRADVKAIKAMAGSEGGAKTEDSHNNASPWDNLSEGFSKLPDGILTGWTQQFHELDESYRARGVLIKWFIVEGWHLYYDAEVIRELDLRLLLRCSSNVLRQRRAQRKYITPEGLVWVDPPYYWKDFTYPAYLRTHSRLFRGGEVEVGSLSHEAESENIILLDGEGTQRNLPWKGIFQHAVNEVLLKSAPPRT